MNFLFNSVVLSLHVFDAEFQKKGTVFVPGREFYSLTFRKNGAVSITADGKTIVSEAPCITFVPKGKSYHTEILQSGSMIAVHFFLTEEAEQQRSIKLFTPPHPTVIQSLFSILFEAYHIEQPRNYTCLSLFYEILALLETYEWDEGEKRISNRMKKAKAYIDKSFSDPSLSVSKLSELLGISQVYFRKEFKASFGTTPLAYINEIRFKNAKAMLKTGYYSVGDVAEKCGFMSLSYFSGAFHQTFGISPTEYIKRFDSSSPFS